MKKSLFNQKGISGVLIAIIIAAVLIFAAGGYYMLTRSGSGPSPSASGSTAAPQKPASKKEPISNASSTFQDIVGKGQNLECDWHLPTSGAANPFGTGKLYTTGNKGRSMIKGTTNGIEIDANVIYTDEAAYSWVIVAGTTVGYKFDKAELQKMASEMTPEQKQQAEQIRAKMIFSCKGWTPDESKFILPTGVEFK